MTPTVSLQPWGPKPQTRFSTPLSKPAASPYQSHVFAVPVGSSRSVPAHPRLHEITGNLQPPLLMPPHAQRYTSCSFAGQPQDHTCSFSGHVSLPEASVRNPSRDKVMRKEADIRKVVIRLQGSPWNFLSMYPNNNNKNLPAFVLCFSTFLIFSGKKSNQGFSLLHLKGMFQLNPSDSSLACLTGSPDLLQPVNCLQPPNRRRHKA